jgi:hypothetical protein
VPPACKTGGDSVMVGEGAPDMSGRPSQAINGRRREVVPGSTAQAHRTSESSDRDRGPSTSVTVARLQRNAPFPRAYDDASTMAGR